MKKTILFIPGFVCDTWCTIEQYTIDLTEVLSDEYNIIWLAPSINNPYNLFKNKEKLSEPLYVTKAKKHNIKVITADLSKFNLIKNLFILKKIFNEYKVDATYTEFGFERQIATICSKLLGMKTIFRAHGHLGGNYKFLKGIVLRYFIDYFLPVSYYVEGFIPKNKKVYTVRNVVDINKKAPLSEEDVLKTKKELGLEKFDQIVLMIAGVKEVKRYDVAIDIAENVKSKTNKNVGFVFVGYDKLYNQYLEEVKKRNLDSLICMTGHTTEVEKYLSVSDISMLTSLEEGLPCSFLESMNYRLPLIAFNRAWARELVTNGINGYLIDVDDKDSFANSILELLHNEDKRIEFGQNSYTILKENFNMDLWRKKMKKAFDEIMK